VSRYTTRSAALLVLAAGLTLPACQSDGSIGRDDSYKSIVWREEVRRETYRRNLAATKNTLASIPERLVKTFTDFPRKMGMLRHLYIDGVGERWTYQEQMAEENRGNWEQPALLQTPFKER
jgi:hypothetical protein